MTLDAQARADVVIDDVPHDVGTVEVAARRPRPVGRDARPAGGRRPRVGGRARGADPARAASSARATRTSRPRCRTCPNVELYGVTPKDYGAATQRTDGRPWDLMIFEGDLPATLPTTPILAIAPPRTSPLGEVTGTLTDPGIGSLDPDEPILRYVDLSTTHISAGAAADDAGLGPDRHPGAEGLAAAVHRRPRRPADRGPGLRAAPLRPAAAGRLPDPAREPDRRAARRLDRADRGGRARRAGHPPGPGRGDRRAASPGPTARPSSWCPSRRAGRR